VALYVLPLLGVGLCAYSTIVGSRLIKALHINNRSDLAAHKDMSYPLVAKNNIDEHRWLADLNLNPLTAFMSIIVPPPHSNYPRSLNSKCTTTTKNYVSSKLDNIFQLN
jgi:hypothetical protein